MKYIIGLTLSLFLSTQAFSALAQDEFGLAGRYEDPKSGFQFDFNEEGQITNTFHYNISKTEKIDVKFDEPLVLNEKTYSTSTTLKTFENECALNATLFVTPNEDLSAIDVTLQLPTDIQECVAKNVVNFDFYAEKKN